MRDRLGFVLCRSALLRRRYSVRVLSGLVRRGSYALMPAKRRAREVLRAPEFYRQKVEELVQPKLVEMTPQSWWKRSAEISGLCGESSGSLDANVQPRGTR